MITITASNGSKGRGETIVAACHALLGDRQQVAVKRGRGWFVPIEEATAEDVRHSGALWVKPDRSWKVALLIDDVSEGTLAP